MRGQGAVFSVLVQENGVKLVRLEVAHRHVALVQWLPVGVHHLVSSVGHHLLAIGVGDEGEGGAGAGVATAVQTDARQSVCLVQLLLTAAILLLLLLLSRGSGRRGEGGRAEVLHLRMSGGRHGQLAVDVRVADDLIEIEGVHVICRELHRRLLSILRLHVDDRRLKMVQCTVVVRHQVLRLEVPVALGGRRNEAILLGIRLMGRTGKPRGTLGVTVPASSSSSALVSLPPLPSMPFCFSFSLLILISCARPGCFLIMCLRMSPK
ncbi:hypothetical protein TYRP_010946 [Tyrophagus putrescentiae]|nr:hypothetical protein TYRP_010946 [Tyrophagus putrescentiae]